MKHVLLTALIVVPLVVGVSIPSFYDWTGMDQSRPWPGMLATAGGILLSGIISCCLLPWLPIADERDPAEQTRKTQFQIRTVLIATGAVALMLVALMYLPKQIVGGCTVVAALGYIVRQSTGDPASRLPSAALLACMYLPYTWLLTWKSLSVGLVQMIGMFAGLPNFFPTLMTGGLLGQHSETLFWLSMVLTSGQLVFGAWLISAGPRRAMALMIYSLVLSIYGSFILNALVRV